ncbi:hypothetical protein pipiens_003422 [Culex pipiens pipiens]|uniref:Uncharacterized protein n=1 Tax=Culex pipiens pipiens TaxID=38569 RepID=A0ABD1CY82_CULPP
MHSSFLISNWPGQLGNRSEVPIFVGTSCHSGADLGINSMSTPLRCLNRFLSKKVTKRSLILLGKPGVHLADTLGLPFSSLLLQYMAALTNRQQPNLAISARYFSRSWSSLPNSDWVLTTRQRQQSTCS